MVKRWIARRYGDSISHSMGYNTKTIRRFEDTIDFSLGDPDFHTSEQIIKKAFEDALKGHTHYTDFFGDPELIEEICKFYQEDFGCFVDKREVMVTTSGCHALWLAMQAIINDGEEVILTDPHFTPYSEQIKMAGGIPKYLPTFEKEKFEVNPSRLETLITEKTKAVILNIPNNPTGACLDLNTLYEIGEICQSYDLIVIADHCYSNFSFGKEFVPIFSLPQMKERTISTESFSKNYAMTGWRIGYTVAHESIIQVMKEINENNVFTAPSISQRAAIYALRYRKSISAPIIKEIEKRMGYAYRRVNKIPKLSSILPDGGMYLFVNIKNTGLPSHVISQKIFEESHILILPGTMFGQYGEGYLRLALTVNIEKMEEAFDRIEKMDIFKMK